jgi:hypothetical protein
MGHPPTSGGIGMVAVRRGYKPPQKGRRTWLILPLHSNASPSTTAVHTIVTEGQTCDDPCICNRQNLRFLPCDFNVVLQRPFPSPLERTARYRRWCGTAAHGPRGSLDQRSGRWIPRPPVFSSARFRIGPQNVPAPICFFRRRCKQLDRACPRAPSRPQCRRKRRPPVTRGG